MKTRKIIIEAEYLESMITHNEMTEEELCKHINLQLDCGITAIKVKRVD